MSPTTLRIYGSGWSQLPQYSSYYHGTLPQDQLPVVYAESAAVLALTMDAQRDYGMVNNRVFEILASGVPIVTEEFEEVRKVVGEGMGFYYDNEDVQNTLEGAILGALDVTSDERRTRGQKQYANIVEEHSYENRMKLFVAAVENVKESTALRKGRFTVGVLHGDYLNVNSDIEALAAGLAGDYRVTLLHVTAEWLAQNPTPMDVLEHFDVLLTTGSWDSSEMAVFITQPWPRKWLTRRGVPQIRGWIMPASTSTGITITREDLAAFDVIYAPHEFTARRMRELCGDGCGSHVDIGFGTGVMEVFGAVPQGELTTHTYTARFEQASASSQTVLSA